MFSPKEKHDILKENGERSAFMSVDVLQEKIRKMKNPTMFGLDPTPELIPTWLLKEKIAQFGHTPEAYAEAYYRFCSEILM